MSDPCANPAAVERASLSDKQWFAGHPGVTQRIRPVIPGETGDIDPAMTHVVVEQLAPGIRRKKFVQAAELIGATYD